MSEDTGTEVELAIARPLITPEQAAEMARELRKVIADVLVKGKHYQPIRGKDVLLKAGAEELQKVFGLNFTYSDLDTHRDEATGMFEASIKCSVRNSSGTILAESYGFFDQSEKMGQKGGPPGPNTIVKMAQKRAYVGAIMSATGTSELFTQDIDDEPPPPKVVPSTPDQRLLLAELIAQHNKCSIVDARAIVDEYPKKGERDWVARQIMNILLRGDERPETENPEPEKNPGSGLSTQPDVDSEEEYTPEPELPPDPPPITIDGEAEEDDPFV